MKADAAKNKPVTISSLSESRVKRALLSGCKNLWARQTVVRVKDSIQVMECLDSAVSGYMVTAILVWLYQTFDGMALRAVRKVSFG